MLVFINLIINKKRHNPCSPGIYIWWKRQSTENKLKITDCNKSWKAISRVIDKGKMTRKDMGGVEFCGSDIKTKTYISSGHLCEINHIKHFKQREQQVQVP